jgi:agmatine/peptidylarginine deiminase
MVAEFEHQSALTIAWDASDLSTRDVLVQVIQHASSRLPILVLVKDQADHVDAFSTLQRLGLISGRIRFIRAPVDSPWTRDYGPIVVRCGRNPPLMIDAVYDADVRPNDNHVPSVLSSVCACRLESTGLRVEGGNLLTNGDGLAITSERLIEQNTESGFTLRETLDRLQVTYGLDRVISLLPLEGETTGHVDMFATFTSINTVVVGSYDPAQDPVNADYLDRNADALVGLPTSAGPLQVVRVPMPQRADSGDTFPTWTNVVYANRTLLMPVYPGLDPEAETTATQIFERLLPGWKIVPVDCSGVIESGGALHCLALNLPSLPVLPLSPSINDTDLLPPVTLPLLPPALPLPFPEDVSIGLRRPPTLVPLPMFRRDTVTLPGWPDLNPLGR